LGKKFLFKDNNILIIIKVKTQNLLQANKIQLVMELEQWFLFHLFIIFNKNLMDIFHYYLMKQYNSHLEL